MGQIVSKNRIPVFEEYCRKNDIDGKEIEAVICGIPLSLTVASTPQSQAKGLGEIDNSPSDNCGMIFVYDDDQPLSFWMKGVKFPLDIIFFDSEMKYIDHKTMDPGHDVEDAKLPRYHSKKPARFAVELPGGWCEKNMTPDCTLSF